MFSVSKPETLPARCRHFESILIPTHRKMILGFGMGNCRRMDARLDAEDVDDLRCARLSSSSMRHRPFTKASQSRLPLLCGSHSFLDARG